MNIYWASGPWRGRLGIGPRPRGNDWLEDDLTQWRRAGIDAIVSLLTRDEEQNLGLINEATAAQHRGMTFISYPIPDLQVPASRQQFSIVLNTIDAALLRKERLRSLSSGYWTYRSGNSVSPGKEWMDSGASDRAPLQSTRAACSRDERTASVDP